jgi:hypothetical protein
MADDAAAAARNVVILQPSPFLKKQFMLMPIAKGAPLLPLWHQGECGTLVGTRRDYYNDSFMISGLEVMDHPLLAQLYAPDVMAPEPETLDGLDDWVPTRPTSAIERLVSATTASAIHVPVRVYSFTQPTMSRHDGTWHYEPFLDPYRDAEEAMLHLLRNSILPAVLMQSWGLEKCKLANPLVDPRTITRADCERIGIQSSAKNKVNGQPGHLEDSIIIEFCTAWLTSGVYCIEPPLDDEDNPTRALYSAELIANIMLRRLGRGESMTCEMVDDVPCVQDSDDPMVFTLQRLHMCIDKILPSVKQKAEMRRDARVKAKEEDKAASAAAAAAASSRL